MARFMAASTKVLMTGQTEAPTLPLVLTLVRGYSSLAHLKSCYAVKNALGIRVIAPELDEAEVAAFLKARRLEAGGCCLREYVVRNG